MSRKHTVLKKATKLNSFSNLLRVVVILFFIFAGSLVLWISTLQIPDFKGLDERQVAESTKIYDRTGKVLLYDVHQNVTRKVVSYGDISPYLRNATIAIEDSNFYNHPGIELGSMIRSTLINLESGSLKQGGSTITQQVIKNTLLTSDKSFARKIKEIILALKLERAMTKEEILTLYLNEIPYGGSIYGVEDASQKFFGVSAKDLTLVQAAYLASIPQAPTFYSPYGNNRAKLNDRKNIVLDKMIEQKMITKTEGSTAKKEVVVFLPRDDGGIKAPHFVEFVKSYLENKYGKDYLETKGLKITTTLNWELEQKAEEIVSKYAADNEKKFNAKNAGMVAIDPKTGQILGMVGSRDYFDTTNDGNFNVTLAHRQPGSTFKPFVYATAFNKGYLPETVLLDLPTQFQTTCSPEGKPLLPSTKESDCYMPVNNDGKYRGPISLRNALAQSINIPAIKLLYLVGINDSIKTAQNMGIAGLDDPMRYGLTLVLGGGEVSPLDLTSAYSVFANEGIRNPYTAILKIEDSSGQILEQFTPEETRVLPENTAKMINSVLSDKVARAPLYGQNSILDIPGRDVAVKTGTTNDYRDAWAVGYLPNIAVGVWAGNNDNTPMEKKVAGFIAIPIWNEFMHEAAKTLPTENFPKPNDVDLEKVKPALRGLWEGGQSYIIDKISGKLATQYTPKETRETKVVRNIHSILYWVNKDDPTGSAPSDPASDPQFNLWETQVQKWARESGILNETPQVIPTDVDDVHRPEFAPNISIQSPVATQSYTSTSRIKISIVNKGKYPISSADYFLNNTYLGSSKTAPFDFSFIPSETSNISTTNTLRIVVYDSVFNVAQVESTLNLSI
ncbi:MAG: PBP1A family penicillin-binding protein [Candidatus Vogelbacteria bacterium]|nr:PBP1A family penicillin-binding protein [Candidatus Vogelbacteria bacterium]